MLYPLTAHALHALHSVKKQHLYPENPKSLFTVQSFARERSCTLTRCESSIATSSEDRAPSGSLCNMRRIEDTVWSAETAPCALAATDVGCWDLTGEIQLGGPSYWDGTRMKLKSLYFGRESW
jgi:hypothetical protein